MPGAVAGIGGVDEVRRGARAGGDGVDARQGVRPRRFASAADMRRQTAAPSA